MPVEPRLEPVVVAADDSDEAHLMSADLDAALRALHTATIHLNAAASGPGGSALVARSRSLVREAIPLLTAAAHLRTVSEPA